MRAVYLFGQTVVHLGPPGFVFIVSDMPKSRLGQVVSGGDIIRLQLADDFDKQGGEAVKRSRRLALGRSKIRQSMERPVQYRMSVQKNEYFAVGFSHYSDSTITQQTTSISLLSPLKCLKLIFTQFFGRMFSILSAHSVKTIFLGLEIISSQPKFKISFSLWIL